MIILYFYSIRLYFHKCAPGPKKPLVDVLADLILAFNCVSFQRAESIGPQLHVRRYRQSFYMWAETVGRVPVVYYPIKVEGKGSKEGWE